MDKLLTIIVPSYNMEKYLPKCLGSLIIGDRDLLQQLEVIVVNDGSKDRTSEIAHEFERKYPGVFRVIDKANGHYGSCINAALQLAQGTFVKVLDADDWFDTDGFVVMMNGLRQTEADVILTDFATVDEFGAVSASHSFQLPVRRLLAIDELRESQIGFLNMHAVAYRLARLKTLNYRQSEGIPYTDLEWMFIPMSAMRTVEYVPTVVYRYFLGRDGQSCAADQFVRGIPTNMRISVKMLSDYLARSPHFTAESRDYMRERLMSRLQRIYVYYLLEYRDRLDVRDLEGYDNQLRQLSQEWYDRLGSLTLTRLFKFAYIREWRRHHSNATLKFKLFRFYQRLRG